MAKAKKTAKKGKGRQGQIPGTERKTIQAIDDAALNYETHRDKRIAAGKKEADALAFLLAQMREHKKEIYRFDDGDDECTVRLDQPAVKPKVERKSSDAEG